MDHSRITSQHNFTVAKSRNSCQATRLYDVVIGNVEWCLRASVLLVGNRIKEWFTVAPQLLG